MIIVAIMKVRRSELDAFRAFESIAVSAMRVHGGTLERTVVVDDGVVDDGVSEHIEEIHVIQFTDDAAFHAYKQDARLAVAKHLRDRAVVGTQLFVGTEGPQY
jgi:hypothetical protein